MERSKNHSKLYLKANTGLWTPQYIMDLDDLTFREKSVLSKILHLDNEDGCYANNHYFSEYFNLSKTRISTVISSLIKKGYIKSRIDQSKGNKRILNTLPKVTDGVTEEIVNNYESKVEDPLQQVFKHNKKSNKKLIKDLIKKNSERSSPSRTRFDELKEYYSDDINRIFKVYQLPQKEQEFCIEKYNGKRGRNSVLTFENFVSNWKRNLNSNKGDSYKNNFDTPKSLKPYKPPN